MVAVERVLCDRATHWWYFGVFSFNHSAIRSGQHLRLSRLPGLTGIVGTNKLVMRRFGEVI